MRSRTLLLLVALAPLGAVYACSGGDTTAGDAGPDGSKPDATLDAPKDTAASDAPPDVANDATNDVTSDVAKDATTDAAGDAASDGSADATVTDATADAGSKWNTPTCDGNVSASEYGGASNETTSGTQHWYMTWDATNLYVGLDTANTAEGSVIYVGFSGSGITAGRVYDSTGGTLPFKADAVIYAHDGYKEIRLADADASTWSGPATNMTYCSDGNTTREEVIPWTSLGATSIPSSFRFLAYATSSGGTVYGQIPTGNPSGSIGTSATFTHDFYVTSTADGTGSFPFGLTE